MKFVKVEAKRPGGSAGAKYRSAEGYVLQRDSGCWYLTDPEGFSVCNGTDGIVCRTMAEAIEVAEDWEQDGRVR